MRYPDLDIDLLRAFVAVAETGGFTAAAQVIGRSQSAVSQKIQRLEELLGRRLFERTSRSLGLTRDGERLLSMGRRLLELNEIAVRALVDPPATRTLRLGITDDLVPRQLPALLARFGRRNPEVHLELKSGLSRNLLAAYDAGELDAVIAKQHGSAPRGRVIWREPLVWVTKAGQVVQPDGRVPLVTLPPPCTYRDLMIDAMESRGRPWFAACTAGNLMGIQAAVAGGLGFSILCRSLVQDGLQILEPSEEWPPLPMGEIVVVGEENGKSDVLRPLVAFLTDSLAGEKEMP